MLLYYIPLIKLISILLESLYTILVSIAITITNYSTRYPRVLVLVSVPLPFRLRSVDIPWSSLREATIAVREGIKWPSYLFIGNDDVIASTSSPSILIALEYIRSLFYRVSSIKLTPSFISNSIL